MTSTNTTPDELYRMLVSATLDAVLAGKPTSPAAEKLFDELVARREPDADELKVRWALHGEVDLALKAIFITAGAEGITAQEAWAKTATELALEDAAEEAEGGDTRS